MNNWYIEVRTPKAYKPMKVISKGSRVSTRYTYEKLVEMRLNTALEDALDNGIKVTKAMRERWLKTIQTEVTAYMMRKGQI